MKKNTANFTVHNDGGMKGSRAARKPTIQITTKEELHEHTAYESLVALRCRRRDRYFELDGFCHGEQAVAASRALGPMFKSWLWAGGLAVVIATALVILERVHPKQLDATP